MLKGGCKVGPGRGAYIHSYICMYVYIYIYYKYECPGPGLKSPSAGCRTTRLRKRWSGNWSSQPAGTRL